MLTNSFVQQLSTELEVLRGSGRDLFKFDARDHGNYGPYNLERDWGMLERMDPSGLAAGLLLDAMIEATIAGSVFDAARVLREEGFLEKVRMVLSVKARLAAELDAPRLVFGEKIAEALATISPDYGQLNTREVACCLRDALFSIDTGLTLHWLRCDVESVPGPLPLAADVLHFPDMPAFIEALQYLLPPGSFVVCINHHDTVLGFKQPGRIAYLSRYAINLHTGQLRQNAKSGSNLAEQFDLGEPSERFPDWTPARTKWAQQQTWSSRAVEPSKESGLTKLSDLPRDVVLWAALLTEMMRQRLAVVDPTMVVLTESLTRALPNRSVQLPAVRPNYTLNDLPLQEMFDTLGFDDPWLKEFLRPALEGVTLEHLLPVGEDGLALSLDAPSLSAWPEGSSCYGMPGGYDRFAANHVQVTPVSAFLVGTRQELENARKTLLGRNMTNYLLAWANRKIAVFWVTEAHDWFKTKVQARLPGLLTHPSVTQVPRDAIGTIHFYNQSTKHKTYFAKCWLSPKLDPTCRILISPKDSDELVEMLGLRTKKDLPELLRGWRRLPNSGQDNRGPYGVPHRWAWNNLGDGKIHEHAEHHGAMHQCSHKGFLQATVSVNEASLLSLASRSSKTKN